MAVLNMKPHVAWVCQSTGNSVDEDGNTIFGTDEWIELSKCDVVPAGQANKIPYGDGETTTYAYTVYLPVTCRDLSVGERLRLQPFGGDVSETVHLVKGFHRYQHQCKAWI
jgi:hypothetical protein